MPPSPAEPSRAGGGRVVLLGAWQEAQAGQGRQERRQSLPPLPYHPCGSPSLQD